MRVLTTFLGLALLAVAAGAALAAGPMRYDSRAMRECFAARSDVVQTSVRSTAAHPVLHVAFADAEAVVVFGADELDARARGKAAFAAAHANAGGISAAGSTGNLAFFVTGTLTSRAAGEIRRCFAQAARSTPDFTA